MVEDTETAVIGGQKLEGYAIAVQFRHVAGQQSVKPGPMAEQTRVLGRELCRGLLSHCVDGETPNGAVQSITADDDVPLELRTVCTTDRYAGVVLLNDDHLFIGLNPLFVTRQPVVQ